MGTMQHMPEETSEKAQRSDTDIWQRERESRLAPERLFDLPENLESVAGLIPDLFQFTHGADNLHRDAFAKRVDSLLPYRAYDIAGTIRSAYDAFSIYKAIDATPVVQFDDAILPASPASWMRDLVSTGRLADDERFDSASAIRRGFQEWVSLREGNSVINFRDGLSLFRENLEKFILKRLQGIQVSDNTPLILAPPNIQKGLYSVTVHCHTSGYRILSSPAYFIDWTYFGAPSFPVTNSLLPGRYIFGTDSVPGCVLLDGAIFRIPYDFNPQLMRF